VRNKHWISIGASIILGLIFIVAGLGKLLHQPDAVRIFFIPLPDFLTATLAKAVFIWLPRLELMVGLLLVMGIAAKLVATFSSVLIAGFIAHGSLLIRRDRLTVFGYSNAGFNLNHIVLASEKFLQYLSLVFSQR